MVVVVVVVVNWKIGFSRMRYKHPSSLRNAKIIILKVYNTSVVD